MIKHASKIFFFISAAFFLLSLPFFAAALQGQGMCQKKSDCSNYGYATGSFICTGSQWCYQYCSGGDFPDRKYASYRGCCPPDPKMGCG